MSFKTSGIKQFLLIIWPFLLIFLAFNVNLTLGVFQSQAKTYLYRNYMRTNSNVFQRYDPYYNAHQFEQAIIRQKPLREHEKPQDLRNVPGSPGIDYPIYHEVPETSFSCSKVPVHPGMYANVETGCQVRKRLTIKKFAFVYRIYRKYEQYFLSF